jgi:integrase
MSGIVGFLRFLGDDREPSNEWVRLGAPAGSPSRRHKTKLRVGGAAAAQPHAEGRRSGRHKRAWSDSQADEQLAADQSWQDTGLVFTNHLGAALDAGNVRKMFKRICTEAGTGDGWTLRELRTTFVSLMSHRGVSIEEIARLVGHASTRTTEIVYRRELRPVITTGAEIMDELFSGT